MGVTITYTKVMDLVKNHLHDESSNGRTSAKPHGEPGFESQLVDQSYIMRKKINNMTPGTLKMSC